MESMVNINEFVKVFSGKKVFLTGHTGFKGSWMLLVLKKLGADVKGYSLKPSYSNSLFSYIEKEYQLNSIIDDIRNKEKLKKEILDFNPDFIFHLAAQPLVRKSYQIPTETFEVNVIGTANILESILELENRCSAVLITTDKVYENNENNQLFKESDRLGGYDPYSASKACAELVVSSYRNSFFSLENFPAHKKSIATARAGNVIGGGDWSEDRIIPDTMRAINKNGVISLRNPKSVRPWQHVIEPVIGYLILAAKLHNEPAKFSTAYNFGPVPNDHLTVQELVEFAISSFGKGSWNDVSDINQLHEAIFLKLDISKAMLDIQWKPKLNAKEAINWTIEWYKKNESEKLSFTINQIEEYLKK
jgi:CDP-glucose 4,6-dehydratase